MSGAGPAKTPRFPVDEEKYTIRIACVGKGTILLDKEKKEDKENTTEVRCDGFTRRIHVATDAKLEDVSITASESQRWTVSVVISPDLRIITPTPTSLPA